MNKFEGSITAKEEAHEIINSFYFQLPNNGLIRTGINSCSSRMQEAEKCALILVDKILEVLKIDIFHKDNRIDYYQEVKKEILCISSQMK
jgi:hypothetical protein